MAYLRSYRHNHPGLNVSLAFTAIFLFSGCGHSTRATTVSDITPPVLDADYMNHLASFPASPGIVICDPVPLGTDSAAASFASGCGRWLQFTVGGHAEFGETPHWSSLNRARQELKRTDFALSLADVRKLSSMVGATDVAIGQIAGTSGKYTVTYQVYSLPDAKAIGKPISTTGTKDEIVAKLPLMASEITELLGVTAPRVPQTVGATPAELTLFGGLIWTSDGELSDAGKAQITHLALKLPIAGLLKIDADVPESDVEWAATVKTLLEQAPDNPMTYSEVGRYKAVRLYPYADKLMQLCGKYPQNYMLASSETWMDRRQNSYIAEAKAAQRVVRCAPKNPNAWLNLGSTLWKQAKVVRQGRYADDLSESETAYVNAVYAQWFTAVKRAAELDPLFAKAWEEVASAECFSGDSEAADASLWWAVKLDPDDSAFYQWGLEQFQPKWVGNPASLDKLAKLAVNVHYESVSDAVDMVDELNTAGKPELASQLLSGIIRKAREALAKNPKDAHAHHDLGLALEAKADHGGAIAQLAAAVKLRPVLASPHFELAEVYREINQGDKADAEYREAIRLDPENPDYYASLGWLLNAQQKFAEAEPVLLEAIRIEPDLWGTRNTLGEVYKEQNRYRRAIIELRKSNELMPNTYATFSILSRALDANGNYDEAIADGKRAVELYAKDPYAYITLADAYLNIKDFASSVKMSKTALNINPDDEVSHENLGEAYIGQGKREQARAEWNKVLELVHDGPIAEDARNMLKQYP